MNGSSDLQSVCVVVDDDLRRWRLTVFFRLLLAIPLYVWLVLWTVAAAVAAVVNWIVTLVRGVPPAAVHSFLSRYVRYDAHVSAYLYLAANEYPPFNGRQGEYAIDVLIPAPARQRRWTVAIRIVLALPALVLAAALVGGGVSLSGTRGRRAFSASAGGVGIVSFLAWFATLARGRTPRGLRDFVAYGIGYAAQVWAYTLVLTDRYPNTDPEALGGVGPIDDVARPVRLVVLDDLRRSRLTVFFRVLLFLPHLVWLVLWGLLAAVASIASWFATLALGRSPRALHRFLSRYVRYATHAYAFLYLTGSPFPGFAGAPGSYPIDLEIDEPSRQNRWKVGFRLLLAIPALLLNGVFGNLLFLTAVFGWWAALITGRMPQGYRNLGAFALRYAAELGAYLTLLTDRYPFSGPFPPQAAADPEEPAPAVPRLTAATEPGF